MYKRQAPLLRTCLHMHKISNKKNLWLNSESLRIDTEGGIKCIPKILQITVGLCQTTCQANIAFFDSSFQIVFKSIEFWVVKDRLTNYSNIGFKKSV